MRVLATGANGHLGANVTRALLKRGHHVVPFVRRGADLRGLEGLGLEYVYGDVLDRDSMIAAAKGCDAIIHMAAVYRYWAKDLQEIMQPALEGTRNAFAAAKEAGIRRMVYTSTVWTVGVGEHPNELHDAQDWNDDARNPYAAAKTQAEREAWQLADEHDIEMISFCPGGMIGPYDYRVTPSMVMIGHVLNGTAPVYKGGLSFVDVRDVAEVHAAAVDSETTGKRYVAAGTNITIEDNAQQIAELTGIRSMRLPGGRSALQMVAALSEFASKFTGSAPLITRELADELGDRYMYYDSGDTYRAFGVIPTKHKDALVDSIRWMIHAGQVKPKVAARLAPQFPPDPEWVA